MVPPEDRPLVERHAARVLAGEQPPSLEHRICRKDGTVRWVLSTWVPRFDEHRQLVSYDGLLHNVAERKEADLALRHLTENLEQRVAEQTHEVLDSEGRFHAILNTAADAIVTIDERGIILGVNVTILMPSPYRDEHGSYLAHYRETHETRIIGIGSVSLNSAGVGLRIMKHRAELIGAKRSIAPIDSRGTQVTCTVNGVK